MMVQPPPVAADSVSSVCPIGHDPGSRQLSYAATYRWPLSCMTAPHLLLCVLLGVDPLSSPVCDEDVSGSRSITMRRESSTRSSASYRRHRPAPMHFSRALGSCLDAEPTARPRSPLSRSTYTHNSPGSCPTPTAQRPPATPSHLQARPTRACMHACGTGISGPESPTLHRA